MRKFLYILLIVVLAACQSNLPETGGQLRPCAPMPEARVSAVGFGVGSYGYVFGGRKADGSQSNALWRYTAQTNTWLTMAETPLQARVSAAAIAVGEQVYIGLGITHGVYLEQAHLKDWWRYTPATDKWERLSDYPNANTVGVTCYEENGYIYCVYGFGKGFSRDVIRYDISTDTWTTIDEREGKSHAVMGGTGASIGGRHFFGTGFNTWNKNTWFELQPEGDWQERRHVPGGRSTATAAATTRYIYLIGGRNVGGDMSGGGVLDDVLRYDAEQDRWSRVAKLETGADKMISFTIQGKVYTGLGETQELKALNTLYCIED